MTPLPCLLCGGLVGKHRDSCPVSMVKPYYEREPGMQTMKIISPVKFAPALVQRLWLCGLSLQEIAQACGATPQEVEDVMRKRTARLARERGKR